MAPLGLLAFFSAGGLRVFLSEVTYVWVPPPLLVLVIGIIRRSLVASGGNG